MEQLKSFVAAQQDFNWPRWELRQQLSMKDDSKRSVCINICINKDIEHILAKKKKDIELIKPGFDILT